MNWIDESKGLLDYLLASVPALTLVFLISAYFHTVHPRFEKTEELDAARHQLKSAETRIKEAQAEIEEKKQELAAISEEFKYYEKRLDQTQAQLDSKSEMLFQREADLEKAQGKMDRLNQEAVDAHKLRLLDGLVSGAINQNVFSKNEKFNIKQFVINKLDNCENISSTHEQKACYILLEFANTQLKDSQSEYKHLIPAFVYSGENI